MSFDAHKNFAIATVSTPPSPGGSGTSLTVNSGQGALFPAVPFNATVWPTGVTPISTNAEIVRVTNIIADTLTITRQQEGSSGRVIVATDQIAASVTAKTLTDVESATTFLYPATGAVSRTGNAKMADLLSVLDFGAVADAAEVTDAAITTGTATLTSASNPWTVADVGKHIAVAGAGGSVQAPLVTTIAGYVAAGQVTLTANATRTVSGAQAQWGTDNRAAMQAALDAVPDGGCDVIIPSGKYMVAKSGSSALVLMNDYTRVVGTGRPTIFTNDRDTRILTTNDKDYCRIEGLRLVGMGKDVGTGTSSGLGAIATTGNSNYTSIIDNIIEKACGSGIVDDGNQSTIAFNQILETGEHGIYSSSPQQSRYMGNRLFNAGKDTALTPTNGVHGIKMDGSQYCAYIGNVIDGAAGLAIELASTTLRNTVVGNVIYHTGLNDAISVSGGTATENVISENTIYLNTATASKSAIDVSQGLRCSIKGNIITVASASSGIYLNTNAAKNDVCENTLIAEGSAVNAIYCNAVDDNVCARNTVIQAAGTWQAGLVTSATADRNAFLDNSVAATTRYSIVGRDNVIRDTGRNIVSVTTTDATLTALFTQTLNATDTYGFRAVVVARKSGGSDHAQYVVDGLASGNTATVHASAASVTLETDATWPGLTVGTDGGDGVQFKVQGLAATTITWRLAEITFERVS